MRVSCGADALLIPAEPLVARPRDSQKIANRNDFDSRREADARVNAWPLETGRVRSHLALSKLALELKVL